MRRLVDLRAMGLARGVALEAVPLRALAAAHALVALPAAERQAERAEGLCERRRGSWRHGGLPSVRWDILSRIF